MKYPFQELKTTNAPYSEELKTAAAAVIDSGWYLHGPETERFEQTLASAVGTRHSCGCGTGLDALRLIFRGYMELGRLKPGDEVIVPANTFIATILPLTELGLDVRLADPRMDTHCITPADAEALLGPRTQAVAITHLYGFPSWHEEGARRLREKGILLIEDNAQAIGAQWHRHPTGSLGDASAISFYPGKNIGALGDAGAVCTDDAELDAVVRALHDYGSDRRYHYPYRGYNSRIDEMQAAFLNVKLRHLDEVCRQRSAAARKYLDTIRHPEIVLPVEIENCRHVWHQFVIRTPHRDALATFLHDHGVGTGIHYPIPPHLQPCYKGVWHDPLPVTELLAQEVLSLPIANILPKEAEEIAMIVNRFTND